MYYKLSIKCYLNNLRLSFYRIAYFYIRVKINIAEFKRIEISLN